MEILFVSSTCSKSKYVYIYDNRRAKMLDPSQKFYDLLLNGMCSTDKVKIKCLSAVPVSASSINKKLWIQDKEEVSQNLEYVYLGFINGRITRYLTLYITSFISTLKWAIENRKKKDKVLLCDPLVFMCSKPARVVSRLFGIKNIAIITDIPSYSTSMKQREMNILRKAGEWVFEKLANKDTYKYDSYIFLAEAMNAQINPQNKPYIVVEGSVDKNMAQRNNTLNEKNKPKVIMYAGGIYEKYGIGNLIRAFQDTQINDFCLHLYGDGSYTNEVNEISKKDSRIRYYGVLSVDDIVKEEIKATLLVNPRPSKEEFTKYSFPSKILEYMVSGTPVLTTRLASIPPEYDNYLYYFEDETIAGMSKTMELILSKSKEELHEKGLNAKMFSLEKKNNHYQGKKIVDFIKELTYCKPFINK